LWRKDKVKPDSFGVSDNGAGRRLKHILPQETWAQQMYSIPACSLYFGAIQLSSSVEFLLGTLSFVLHQLPLQKYQTGDELSYVITKDSDNYHNLAA